MKSFKQFIDESINDKNKFKAVFLAGTPYAGKSYTVDNITDGNKTVKIINTDTATEFLMKKYKQSQEEVWALLGKEKIKGITKEQLYHTLNNMHAIIVDGTSSSAQSLLKRKGILESLGYDTALLFVDTPLELSLERMKSGNRERNVPEELIKTIYEKAQELKPYYKKIFKDDYHEIAYNSNDINDKDLYKLYKSISKFFNSKIDNPLAARNIKQIKAVNDKYIVPTVLTEDKLKKLVNGWY